MVIYNKFIYCESMYKSCIHTNTFYEESRKFEPQLNT